MFEKLFKKWKKNPKEMEKHAAEICDFYDYEMECKKRGTIIIRGLLPENVYKYQSTEELVKDWKAICKMTNDAYIKDGWEKPFQWL